jgi:PAS domain S-box-containing protein
MFVALDPDGRVTLINTKGCEILECGEHDIVGQNWFDVFLPERMRESVRGVFRQLMAGEIEPVEYYQNPVLTKTGKEKIIAWHNTVFRDEAGNVNGTLASGEDITERRIAEEERTRLAAKAAVAAENARLYAETARLLKELQVLQSSRDRFFAMVNHELRNALTAVYGWAELLMRASGTDPPRAARETFESAEYALELLNDLLELSRLEAAKIQPQFTKADARKLVEDAVRTVEPSAVEAQVHIEIEGLEGPVSCRTDSQRVRQILVNLLSNAVRHSPPGKAVTVRLDAGDSRVEFAVIDRGEGISTEEQKIIFDAYARAESGAGGGTGLGLTLSQRLAHILGGNIGVKSVLGKGATFTVRIKRYAPES